MFLKILKPIHNSIRNKIIICKNHLSKKNIIKKLVYGMKKNAGRNKSGKITIRHKGGGIKKNYKNIFFLDNKFLGIVLSIEFDSSRNSFISLVFNLVNKNFFYLLNTNKISVGCFLSSNFKHLILGCRVSVQAVPLGTLIHSVTSINSIKINYLRAAGSYGQLIQNLLGNFLLKMPSGKIVKILSNSFCTIGVISNIKSNLCKLGKAGYTRLKNIRPSVRGVAMNSVDHPHGGKTNGGRPCVTPWGKLTKGKVTKKNK